MTKHAFIELGLAVLNTEAAAISALTGRLDRNFHEACELILKCGGRIVVTGMGKSGHIGNKIAATLASTGTPSFFMHSGEASHGDLGMITAQDLVIALSNSGETGEITLLLPLLKRIGIPLIALTGEYHFRIGDPDRHPAIAIREHQHGEQVLGAVWQGSERPARDGEFLRACASMPLMTLKVIAMIHWQALRIWLRGASFYRKPAPPERGFS